jgi:hypothetical protein
VEQYDANPYAAPTRSAPPVGYGRFGSLLMLIITTACAVSGLLAILNQRLLATMLPGIHALDSVVAIAASCLLGSFVIALAESGRRQAIATIGVFLNVGVIVRAIAIGVALSSLVSTG